MGYWLEIKMMIRMMIRKEGQLRNNLILILPLHPAAGRSR